MLVELLGGGYAYAKLFTNGIDTKYTYPGSSESITYGSFGPVLTRYARHLHISGNVAYDTRADYTVAELDTKLRPLMRINVCKILPTMFDDFFHKASFSQIHTAWLDTYLESELPESHAHQVVHNPAFLGTRLNTMLEQHVAVPILIVKEANSDLLSFSREDGYTAEYGHRIGRFVFDFDITI